jgi:glyoxylase-like metal-dependent hydrolase (beta-lactamase superfamily II)
MILPAMPTLRLALSIAALSALAFHPSTQAQQPPAQPVRAITRIAGDLYRVQADDHYTVFLVTPAGIILADPINVETAAWIKRELVTRFPATPVRFVIYSHHHQDHASGAAVFDDTAELVGHERFTAALNASAGQNAAAAKRYEAVVPPESTYSGRRTIVLGGKTVQLIHPGRTAHAPDLTVLFFPVERVVFGVDFMAVTMVPGSNTLANGASIPEYVAAIRSVEALDFTIAAPGHGPVGTRTDIARHRQYFEQLAARVAAGIARGQTVQQLQSARIMDEYKSWIEYDEDNDVNIANAYQTLSAQRMLGGR